MRGGAQVLRLMCVSVTLVCSHATPGEPWSVSAKFSVARYNQMHRTIQSAINGKVAAQRRDVRFPFIAHANGQQVRAGGGQIGGDFKTERAESTAMFAKLFAIQIDVRDQTRRFEPQEISFAGFRCDVQFAPIPARSAVKILSLLCLRPAPVVRDRNRLPIGIDPIHIRRTHGLPGQTGGIALHESPARIQQRAFTRKQVEGKDECKNENGKFAHDTNLAGKCFERKCNVTGECLRELRQLAQIREIRVKKFSAVCGRHHAVPANDSCCISVPFVVKKVSVFVLFPITLCNMDWLQTLDASLFHFINRSLSNPLFDWLMPILSGNGVMHWFALCIVVALVSALWFGNARVRLCALMLFLVVALGDPLVVNTIKHAVARPRPCMALSDVVQRLGCSGSGSMPSAHAANWFAVTMVAFLFYRRSLWFMLPMAVAVSFSRVYNGVHYPGDVLAGAILGAGYGAAGMIALQTVWNRAGKKWFPLWHAKMPSLLNPRNQNCRSQNPEFRNSNSNPQFEWLRLGYILIFVMLIGRWLYLASGIIQLSQDEAYQWVWSKHLALSYYSKPLGIALIQFAGTSLWGDTELGVRFFSPLFAAILSVMVLRFVAREINARAAFWLLLIVTAVPLLGAGAILMTIDPPLVLCWMWALVAGWRAVQPDGQTRHWLVVGLAMGLGFLCKYSALYQMVCWAVFFVLWPVARVHLRKPGPWLALLIFLICTAPVVIWNWQHGWITVHHVADDAGLQSQWKPTLRYFWDFLFSETALLNPIFLIGSIVSDVRLLEITSGKTAVALFFLHERAGIARSFALFVSFPHFSELDCSRRPADVLSDGCLLGRPLARRLALA